MRQRARGFTLLEVLLTLSFLGVLMLLIGSVLTSSNRMQALSERQTERLTQVRSAQNFIRNALQQTHAQNFGHNFDSDERVFEGERQRMRFMAPLPGQLAGGVQVHTLERVARTTGTSTLQVSFSQNQAQGLLQPWGSPQTLMQRVNNLRFSYRGLDSSQKPTGWLERWPWSNRLPQAVRIEVDSDVGHLWPTQVVTLRLDSEVAP